MTESDSEYVDCLQNLIEAKSKAESLKIRYDSYKNLFEAKEAYSAIKKQR